MKYAHLLERALSEMSNGTSLAEVLSRIDALDKSGPTFEEFTAAVNELTRQGHTAAQKYLGATRETYDAAVAENWELMLRFLEQRGMNRTDIEAVLQRYVALWQKK
jgi:hypothetical protein